MNVQRFNEDYKAASKQAPSQKSQLKSVFSQKSVVKNDLKSRVS